MNKKYYYNFLLLFIFIIIFYLVNNLIKNNENYTGLKTNYFFDNLKANNYKYDDQKNITYCPNNNECMTKNYKYHFNTIESIKLVKNKVETSSLLQQYNIPVPNFLVINVQQDYSIILDKIKQNNIHIPFIIKPINGTFGIDVQKIESLNNFYNTIQNFKKKYQNMMIENYFEGSVYRIFVFQNKIIDVIKRDKPYIIGNGYDTVEFLINKRNKSMVENGFFETKNLSLDYMEKQGYTMHSILPSQTKLYITNVINMHNGALLERIPISNIPVKNLDLFLKVGQVIKINCYGLDYISKDITEPFQYDKDVILEVNGTPDTEIHTKIDNYGDKFFKEIVSNIF